MAQIVPRLIEPVIAELLEDEPVIVLDGPRAAGKSVAVQQVVKNRGARLLDLDNPDHQEAVRQDPMTSLMGPGLVVVDEFQRETEAVLSSIKAHLNRDGVSPGRYLLTGSTRADLLTELVDHLGGGRHHRLTLLPFAQAEIESRTPALLRRLMDDPMSLLDHPGEPEEVPAYFERIMAGGFPPAVGRTSANSRSRWFRNYVDDVCARAAEEERVRSVRAGGGGEALSGATALKAVLQAAAAHTGQLLNVANIQRAVGARLGVDRLPAQTTVARWLEILESIHLIYQLEAWGTHLRSLVNHKPKLHMIDSGMAAFFMGVSQQNIHQPNKLTESGHLLETFVISEVLKEMPLLPYRPRVGHYRTADSHEVDLVVEAEDGRVFGVEVKRATQLHSDRDLKGMRFLARKLGDRFGGGAVLHPRPVPARTSIDRVVAVPISTLWAA